MKVEFSNHNILPAHISTYGSYLPIECRATLTDKNGNIESYTIQYYRDPINGLLRGVKCLPKEENETTENTLTCEAVEDYCSDELSFNPA